MTEQYTNTLATMAEPLGVRYTINIDRPITEPCDFREEILTLRTATSSDVVHMLLSSGGGSVETMKCILSAMEQCEAHIITEICGDIASAATMIFLGGSEFRVSDNAEMMVHFVSYASFGKGSDIKRHVDFTHRSSERLMRKYYKHFLTEEEMDSLIEGKEYWMDSDEIMERLQKHTNGVQEEQESIQQQAYEEQMSAIFGEPLPKEALEPLDKETLIKVIRGELSEEEEVELFGGYVENIPDSPELADSVDDVSNLGKEYEVSFEGREGLSTHLLNKVKSLTIHDVEVVEESGLKALKILATPSEGHGDILFFEDNYISYYDINSINELPWENGEEKEKLDYFVTMCNDFGIEYHPETYIEDLEKFHKSVVSYLKSLD